MQFLPADLYKSIVDDALMATPTTRGSVLIIDDDTITLGTFKDLLTINGFSVLTAKEGAKP